MVCACCLQRGDAFDMATLMCCMLLGAGHDAYVVLGTAVAAVAQNDRRREPCPLLPPADAQSSILASSSSTDLARQPSSPRAGGPGLGGAAAAAAHSYSLEEAPDPVNIQGAAGQEPEVAAVESSAVDDVPHVHSWLLVRAGNKASILVSRSGSVSADCKGVAIGTADSFCRLQMCSNAHLSLIAV